MERRNEPHWKSHTSKTTSAQWATVSARGEVVNTIGFSTLKTARPLRSGREPAACPSTIATPQSSSHCVADLVKTGTGGFEVLPCNSTQIRSFGFDVPPGAAGGPWSLRQQRGQIVGLGGQPLDHRCGRLPFGVSPFECEAVVLFSARFVRLDPATVFCRLFFGIAYTRTAIPV